VILAMAAILDTQNLFYPILVRYLESDQKSADSMAATLAMDEAEAAFEYHKSNLGGRRPNRKKPELALIANHAKNFQAAAASYVREKNGAPLSRWILEIPEDSSRTIAQVVLAEAALDDELINHNRLQLLIVHWAAHELRLWVNRLK
jgi:hypothetical protein